MLRRWRSHRTRLFLVGWGPGRGWTWWSVVAGHASTSTCQWSRRYWVKRSKCLLTVLTAYKSHAKNNFNTVYLSCELREDEWCFVNFRVVIFKVHIFHFFFWQWFHWFPEICFLIQKKNRALQSFDGHSPRDSGQVIVLWNGFYNKPVAVIGNLTTIRWVVVGKWRMTSTLTGFLLQSMNPIWPLG